MTAYKRIISINVLERESLLSHASNSISIRPARNGGRSEYVIETTDPNERRAVDKIVDLFAIDR